MQTVEGGGAIVLLLSTLDSLTQLYTLSMDVHSRLRSGQGGAVQPRFNERMVLSLASNPNCLIVDDELNILPTSSLARNIAPLPSGHVGASEAAAKELDELKGALGDAQPAASLIEASR